MMTHAARPRRHARRRVAAPGLAAVGVVLAACRATPPDTPLAALAAGWSPSRTPPACERAERELVEALAATAFGMTGYACTWGAPADSARRGLVWGTIASGRAPSHVYWSRPARDAADAGRFADSLGRALEARGLARRTCESGDVPAGRSSGVVWSSPTLAVHLSRIDPPAGAAPRLHVMAVDDSTMLGPIMHVICPDGTRSARRAPGGTIVGGTTIVHVETTVVRFDSRSAPRAR